MLYLKYYFIFKILFYISESHVKIIEHIPLEQLVTNCSKISLNCLITSSSLSNVYVWWTFNNYNVSKLGSSQINQIAPNQWQLSLDCATLTHSGSYTCHATIQNETQKYDKKETFVKVHGKFIDYFFTPFCTFFSLLFVLFSLVFVLFLIPFCTF